MSKAISSSKAKMQSPLKTIDPAERKIRQRYLGATVITCITIAMVFGTAHVVKLGANRMNDMRDKATYDLADMESHIRAAGEDIVRHQDHEKKQQAEQVYAWKEIESLISAEQWQELHAMVAIPAGEFLMGTDSEKADGQNRPQHTVKLSEYSIDKYLVTNIEYARFVLATKHRPPLDWKNGNIPDGKFMFPVTMVSWYDAQAFCGWDDKRLPTEAEWEKAARGEDGRRWPWGNTMDPSKLNTYYNVGATTEVMSYQSGASPYGVLDMAGNVSQWTSSDLTPYEGTSASGDLFRPKVTQVVSAQDRSLKVADLVEVKGVYKVRRGGSWKSDPFSTATYHRNYSLPHYASDFFGFRCAKSE
jgi:iron(II)-dependent oxidoreductase